jgi:carotenoid cleavage dioxygenase-like enzyme
VWPQVFAVRLKDGTARFSNAWVRTARFQVEQDAGCSVLPMLGDMHGATGLALLTLQHAKASLGCVPLERISRPINAC